MLKRIPVDVDPRKNQAEKVEKVEAQKEVEQGVGDGFPLEHHQIWPVKPAGFLEIVIHVILTVHTISRISPVNVGQLHHATSKGDGQSFTRRRRKNRGRGLG